MKVPFFGFKFCEDVKFSHMSLPCAWFMLALSCAIAAMVAAATDWITIYGTRSDATTFQYRTGLFKICRGGQPTCNNIEFGELAVDEQLNCYSSLNGAYSATAALLFTGIAGCVISIWILWRIWRHTMKGRPRRQKRNRRRGWISCGLTAICFLVSFIIFIACNGTTGCGKKYCDSAHCAFGAPLWFTLGIAILCFWVTYIVWHLELVMVSPIVQLQFETDENKDRSAIILEENRDFEAIWKMAYGGPFGAPDATYSSHAPLLGNAELPARVQDTSMEGKPGEHQPLRQPAEFVVPQQPRRSQPGSPSHAGGLPVLPPTGAPAEGVPVDPFHHARPSLGIEIKMLDDMAGNKECIVVVHSVTPGGPADAAGIQAEDILAKWDVVPLNSKQIYAQCLKGAKVGSLVQLTVVRGGIPMEKQVRLVAAQRKSRGATDAGPRAEAAVPVAPVMGGPAPGVVAGAQPPM